MAGLPEYLRGAVDLHVHTSPDVVPRRFDDVDLAQQAARDGFGALVLKNHVVPTMDRAYLVRKIVPGVSVHGGIVLNDCIGGFNIAAVRAALQLGARAIWMPTRSAHNHKVHEGGHGGLSVFDAHGELRHDVKEICILVAHSQAILFTGHLSPDEGAALVRYAYMQGARRIVVTHPDWGPTRYPLQLQRDLALYEVKFERCHRAAVPVETLAGAIRSVGVESTILSADLGHPDSPPPAESLSRFADQLQSHGLTPTELQSMMVTTPRHLLE